MERKHFFMSSIVFRRRDGKFWCGEVLMIAEIKNKSTLPEVQQKVHRHRSLLNLELR
jgi:hypothetical protein